MSKYRIVEGDDSYEIQEWVPGYWNTDMGHVYVHKTKEKAVKHAKALSCPENPDTDYDVVCVVEDGKVI